MSLPSINFLHLTVSETQPGQTFLATCHHPPTHPDTMGENNTPTAFKGCRVKKPPDLQLWPAEDKMASKYKYFHDIDFPL